MRIKLDLKYELKNFLNKDIQYTIPIFIPHKGCPNDCVFCNQKRISGQIKDVEPNDVKNIIEEYLGYYTKERKIEVAFFGGSFTGIDISLQRAYLDVASYYLKKGAINSIRLSTRPDYINDEILTMLKEYGVGTIELGVQSLNDEVLQKSKRGHSAYDVERASKLIKKYGITLGHQIMIGLPGSTLEMELDTIKKSLEMQPKQLRLYPVYVIQDSELYYMYKKNAYTPLSIQEAVMRCKKIINDCQKTDVAIIRLGLQSTSEITASNENIYGPVSDNFAEYVMSALVRDKIESEIKDHNLEGILEIFVPKKYVSVTVGPKKINKIYFENKYNVKYIVKGEN